jgi:Integrase core domain
MNRRRLFRAMTLKATSHEKHLNYTRVPKMGTRLSAPPLRSPKLSGQIERSHRTHHAEFYPVIPDRWTIAHFNPQLRRWEHIYSTVRPHQALEYSTPRKFLVRWNSEEKTNATNHVDEYSHLTVVC